MTNDRYNTPERGATNWHNPLNENFERLDRDVEIRDLEANRADYDPARNAKFFATDSGAIYRGTGEAWTLLGYVTRAGGGDFGHYVNYEDGLDDEPINRFVLGAEEALHVTRISLPVKGTPSEVPGVALRVYDGDVDGEPLVEVVGNESRASQSDPAAPWIATGSNVWVTVSNATGSSVDVVPKVWTNIRVE